MVRDRVARTAPARHRRLRDLGVERAVHPRRHGSIGWNSFALTLFVVVLFLQPIAAGVSFVSVAMRYAKAVGDERIHQVVRDGRVVVLLTFTATLLTNLPVAQISFDLALVFLYVRSASRS